MNSIEFSWVLILQAVLPFLVLNVVLIMVIMSGRKKYKLAAKKLILAVKSSEDSEKEKIFKFQTEKLAIKPKVAKKNTKKIINERKFIIRNLVSGLIDKNVEAISQLDQDLSQLTNKYHDLNISVVSPPKEAAPEQEEATVVVEDGARDLKKEIKGLKQEVHITLTTLNNIFKEFSSMFGEDDVPDGQLSVDQIITAMESFAGDSDSENVGESSLESRQDESESPTVEPTAENIGESTEAPETEVDTASATQEAEPETVKKIPHGDKVSEVVSPENSLEQNSLTQESQLDESVTSKTSIKNTESETKAENPNESPDDQVPQDDPTSSSEDEELDFSVDAAIDDIDSALDELELDATDEEPDWGDAFAESGDTMEDDSSKS